MLQSHSIRGAIVHLDVGPDWKDEAPHVTTNWLRNPVGELMRELVVVGFMLCIESIFDHFTFPCIFRFLMKETDTGPEGQQVPVRGGFQLARRLPVLYCNVRFLEATAFAVFLELFQARYPPKVLDLVCDTKSHYNVALIAFHALEHFHIWPKPAPYFGQAPARWATGARPGWY